MRNRATRPPRFGRTPTSGPSPRTTKARLSGTVSLRLDSLAGLAADALYRVEVDALRFDGRRVCEFTRLAVDTARLSQPVLAGLFHTVYLFAQRIRNFDFVVIEVNPRHVGFYRRSLGFRSDRLRSATIRAWTRRRCCWASRSRTSPSTCGGTRPRHGAPEGEEPLRVRILARRKKPECSRGCGRSMRVPAAQAGGRD